MGTRVRLLHFADAHLGFESFGRPDPASGLNTRVLDVLARLDEIVQFALREGVHLVCFAGDAFRTSRPGPTLEVLFAERIRRMAAAGVAVLLVAGDHDQPRLSGHRGALDMYSTLGVAGVTVASRPGVVEIATTAGPLAVACLPHKTARRSVHDLVAGMADAVGTGTTTFLAAHLPLVGASTSESQAQFEMAMAPVHLAEVANPRFAYVALGHIRRHQGDLNAGARPHVSYAGSVERIDFGEERDDKGFMVVDLDGDRLACPPEFVPLAARPFHTVTAVIPQGSGPVGPALVATSVGTIAPATDAIVRVRATGSRPDLAHLSAAEVAGLLPQAAEVRLELNAHRPESPRPMAAVGPAAGGGADAALEAWLAAHPELPDRDRIRQRGRQLIADLTGAI